MMMLITAVICFTAAVATVEPPLPEMPTHFSTTITANFAKASERWENTSLHQREYYDFSSNRYHTVTRSANGVHRTLHDLGLNALWVWEGENPHVPVNCTLVLSSDSNSTRQVANRTGHIRPSYQMLNFAGPERTEVWQGQREVNGLLTDVWSAEESFFSPHRQVWVNWTTTFYWTARSWTPSDGSATVPVRAVVEGTHGAAGQGFSHTYEFSSFESGVVDERHFRAPANCDVSAYCEPMLAAVAAETLDPFGDAHRLYKKTCSGVAAAQEQVDVDGKGGKDSKGGALMWGKGILLGALVGAAGMLLFQHVQRRRIGGGLAEQMMAPDDAQPAIQMAAI